MTYLLLCIKITVQVSLIGRERQINYKMQSIIHILTYLLLCNKKTIQVSLIGRERQIKL